MASLLTPTQHDPLSDAAGGLVVLGARSVGHWLTHDAQQSGITGTGFPAPSPPKSQTKPNGTTPTTRTNGTTRPANGNNGNGYNNTGAASAKAPAKGAPRRPAAPKPPSQPQEGTVSIVVDAPSPATPSPVTAAATTIATQASTAVAPSLARAKTAAKVAAKTAAVVGTLGVEATAPSLARARTTAVQTGRDVAITVAPVATAAVTAAAATIVRQPSPAPAPAPAPSATPRPQSGPDPFHAVKEKVHKRLVKTRKDFEDWKEILNKKNTAESREFDPLTRSVSESVRLCRIDLKDLDNANSIVSTHRDTFKDIDDLELEHRMKFVADAHNFLELVEKRFSDPRTKGKIESDARKALASGGTGGTGATAGAGRRPVGSGEDPYSSRGGRDNEALGDQHIAGAMAAQKEQEAQEDEILDDMDNALQRLGGMAKDIQKEIKTTTAMVNELDEQVTSANQTMALVMERLDAILGQREWPRFACIACLAIIVLIMACLAFGIF